MQMTEISPQLRLIQESKEQYSLEFFKRKTNFGPWNDINQDIQLNNRHSIADTPTRFQTLDSSQNLQISKGKKNKMKTGQSESVDPLLRDQIQKVYQSLNFKPKFYALNKQQDLININLVQNQNITNPTARHSVPSRSLHKKLKDDNIFQKSRIASTIIQSQLDEQQLYAQSVPTTWRDIKYNQVKTNQEFNLINVVNLLDKDRIFKEIEQKRFFLPNVDASFIQLPIISHLRERRDYQNALERMVIRRSHVREPIYFKQKEANRQIHHISFKNSSQQWQKSYSTHIESSLKKKD